MDIFPNPASNNAPVAAGATLDAADYSLGELGDPMPEMTPKQLYDMMFQMCLDACLLPKTPPKTKQEQGVALGKLMMQKACKDFGELMSSFRDKEQQSLDSTELMQHTQDKLIEFMQANIAQYGAVFMTLKMGQAALNLEAHKRHMAEQNAPNN